MARITIQFKNGKEVDFESQTIEVTATKGTKNKAHGTVESIIYNHKDKGVSLLFVDYAEIQCITRDTRKEDDFA